MQPDDKLPLHNQKQTCRSPSPTVSRVSVNSEWKVASEEPASLEAEKLVTFLYRSNTFLARPGRLPISCVSLV
jgi:hypothetical protein